MDIGNMQTQSTDGLAGVEETRPQLYMQSAARTDEVCRAEIIVQIYDIDCHHRPRTLLTPVKCLEPCHLNFEYAKNRTPTMRLGLIIRHARIFGPSRITRTVASN